MITLPFCLIISNHEELAQVASHLSFTCNFFILIQIVLIFSFEIVWLLVALTSLASGQALAMPLLNIITWHELIENLQC